MTFSEQIVYAMFKPSKYKEMLELKRSRFVAFIIVMMFVLGTVLYAVPVASRITSFGGFEKLFSKTMSELKFEDGKLSLEKPFEMRFNSVTLLLDAEEPKVADSKMKRDGFYFAIGSEYFTRAYVLDGKISGKSDVKLDKYLPDGFNNDSLVSAIPAFYIALFFGFLAVCVEMFIKYAFFALILSLLISSMNKRMGLSLPSGKCFAICFYGETLAMVLVNFNLALGLLPGFLVSIIGMFITIHMITTASILMLPRNNKNNRI